MGRLRLYLITALAFLLEVLVLLWFPVAGFGPECFPRWCVWWGWSRARTGGGMWIFWGNSLLSGRRHPLADGPAGPIGGAVRGHFPQSQFLLGKVAHLSGRAGGLEVLLVLGHCLAGASVFAGLRIAGPELLLVRGLLPPGCAPDPAQRASPRKRKGW